MKLRWLLLVLLAFATLAQAFDTYRVGSRHENYGETGMAHLLEHMLFKGTPSHRNVWAEFEKRGLAANGSTSYVFSGDANGDTVSGNDLIYIPRDTSEMNFKPLTVSGKVQAVCLMFSQPPAGAEPAESPAVAQHVKGGDGLGDDPGLAERDG